ncbi:MULTISPECIES: hypothetical protein [unclassified Duganella]|uniref:hypothetical protein n=1 Tax=unclassified Duganella TaxID=2636909 RepID=UPI000883B801|nr:MULTISPECIES: hypothetical protein [unclassified Duganella]SDH42118.1 hypothetical protein SAMN05216320_11336 [Duganella sp. OV458]SDK60264.1 hypothetical protein SAMN05428973_113126 [Duganella sp. OV510]
MVRFATPPAPQPMPAVARALIPLKDASTAIQRGLEAWNSSQLQDAIRSAEFFIAKAKLALDDKPTAEQADKI